MRLRCVTERMIDKAGEAASLTSTLLFRANVFRMSQHIKPAA